MERSIHDQFLNKIYNRLLQAYELQGWWPMHGSSTGKVGYHPGDYSLPQTSAQRFEVVVGAILTQNTSWKNVQIVLERLEQQNLFHPDRLNALSQEELGELIRPSGYYNQKARKLQTISRFFLDRDSLVTGKAPTRDDLLNTWGIGPETADSILLYAFKLPAFVVDAYTRRLLTRLGYLSSDSTYDLVQSFFVEALAPCVELYNEYHALIVQHAKIHCQTRPVCASCPLLEDCLFARAPTGKGL
jgi:endonuclease-3 related protein